MDGLSLSHVRRESSGTRPGTPQKDVATTCDLFHQIRPRARSEMHCPQDMLNSFTRKRIQEM